MNKYREVECGGCAPPVHVPLREGKTRGLDDPLTPDEQLAFKCDLQHALSKPAARDPVTTEDRNSDAVLFRYWDNVSKKWRYTEDAGVANGEPLYVARKGTAPPASIPAAEVQALIDELRAEIKPYRNFPTPTDKVRKQCADRLAKLARDYAPEVSQKPPSPRNPE